MRLERFNSEGKKPIGASNTKEVYVNPLNEEKVVSVLEPKGLVTIPGPEGEPIFLHTEVVGIDRDSPRKLKGVYYLTKIAHLLLPKSVPDVYQAGETVDFQQTVDRERVAHTKGQEAFQKQRAAGRATYGAETKMFNEMGGKIPLVEAELTRIGLDPGFRPKESNYSKSADGAVKYLPEFRPWEYTYEQQGQIKLSFNETALRAAIAEIADPETQKSCETYLDRIHTLFEEEQAEHAKTQPEMSLSEGIFLNLKDLFDGIETSVDIEQLFTIATESEALASPERRSVRAALPEILAGLRTLGKTAVPKDKWFELNERYERLAKAVGTVNGDTVDHSR